MGCLQGLCNNFDTVQHQPKSGEQIQPKINGAEPLPQQSPRPNPSEPQPLKGTSKVKPNIRVAIQLPRDKDIVIRIDEIDDRIIEAQNAASGQDPTYAVQIYDKIVKTIHESSDRSMRMMQKLAYSYAQRAAFTTGQNGGSQTFYKFSTQALKIYKLDEVNFHEQITNLLNNMALRDQEEKRYQQAIKKYEEIIGIQSRYMSMYDQRTLITQNNLACLFFDYKLNDQGKALFQKLIKLTKATPISNEVKTFLEKNYEYYKRY